MRVPKYQKIFEALFFAMFLVLYYAVLVERNPRKITFVEVLLYIWIAAFAYDEFGEFRDAGSLFYGSDFWSLWDILIVGIGVAYLITSACLILILLASITAGNLRSPPTGISGTIVACAASFTHETTLMYDLPRSRWLDQK